VVVQAAQTVIIDSKPPTVTLMIPGAAANVSNARPRISAYLDDAGGSKVDTASVKVRVDDVDVTSLSIIRPDFVSY